MPLKKGMSVKMVNFELYRIFKIVADEENITKASEILHISQPAITKHIKNLENELNIKLFKRSKYGKILNENGKKLYLQIRDAISTLSKSEDMFKTHKNIYLGIHVNMPEKNYTNKISKFYENHKETIVHMPKLTSDIMFSMLEDHKIDLAFSKKYDEMNFNKKEIKFIKIGEFHDVFVVNSNSKYLNKKITKKDIKNETIYTLRSSSGIDKKIISTLECNKDEIINIENVNFTAILTLLKNKDILTVISKEYIEENFKNKELCILDTGFALPNTDFGLYYNVNNKFKELEDLINIFLKYN